MLCKWKKAYFVRLPFRFRYFFPLLAALPAKWTPRSCTQTHRPIQTQEWKEPKYVILTILSVLCKLHYIFSGRSLRLVKCRIGYENTMQKGEKTHSDTHTHIHEFGRQNIINNKDEASEPGPWRLNKYTEYLGSFSGSCTKVAVEIFRIEWNPLGYIGSWPF